MNKIIGYHGHIRPDGTGGLINSRGEIRRDPPFLDWLLDQGTGSRQVCYDLDVFAAVLFRLINVNQEEAEALHTNKKLYDHPYEITYIPGKYLGISKGKGLGRPYAGFYDMAQYMDEPELDFEPTVRSMHIKACQAAATAAEVLEIYSRLGLADSLTSPVKALENSYLKNHDAPTDQDNPSEVNDMALKSCPGNWVETFKQGFFKRVYDYDMSGAYPSILEGLYDTRRGDWIQTTERPDNAVYGFANVTVKISGPFSPIIYFNGGERTYTPIGTWCTHLTLAELDFITKYQIGEYEINDAWFWIPVGKRGPGGEVWTDSMFQPYKGIIRNLWTKRSGTEGLEKAIIKRALAGMWGRTLHQRQERGETVYGADFNPVYGAMVEAETRLRVAELALSNRIQPLAVAVDGLVTDKQINIPEQTELGTWRLSHYGAAIIAGSQLVAIETKPGDGDFSLRYNWLKDRIEEDPDASKYTMVKVMPVTLGRAVSSNKLESLGKLEQSTRTVNIGNEKKRYYSKQPATGGDLLNNHYSSRPIAIEDILIREFK